MTRRFSLTVVAAFTVMAVAAPAALARYVEGVDLAVPVVAKGTVGDASDRTSVAPQPQSQELKSLMARSDGLNRMYHLGQYATTGSGTVRDASDRAAVAPQPQSQELKSLMARSEGLNRLYHLGRYATPAGTVRDAADRAAVDGLATTSRDWVVTMSLANIQRKDPLASTSRPQVSGYHDSFERSVLPTGSEPVSAPTVSTGRNIEWPQLGIGFGVGLVLALGLFLAVRFTRIRPLAH